MSISAGITALSASLPATIRTNEYYRERFPGTVSAMAQKSLGKLWAKGESADAWTTEMARYFDDPFRGSVERRVVTKGETALSLETVAANRVLAASGMTPGDVDLMIVSSFQPDQIGVGNAAFLARELGFRRPAWNLESGCSSALVGLHTAASLVESGRYRNVLVVASCTYTRNADDADSVSWFLGDGAGAFIVGRTEPGSGLLGMHTLATTETCDTFYYENVAEPDGPPRAIMKCTPSSGRILSETAEPHLRACCEKAAQAAGVRLSEIDFLACNTPTAWFSAFAGRALGIAPEKTISSFTKTGNIGCALLPVNLHMAALEGKVKRGDLVMLFSVGSVSTASAAVIRWGETALGPRVL